MEHVNAAPWRKEMMPAEVAHRVGDWICQHRPAVVDITGGAPELSEHFRFLVETPALPDARWRGITNILPQAIAMEH
jgi:hypothetical protein